MSDCISREVLLDMFEDEDADVCESHPDGYSKWGFSYEAVRKVVKNIPSADVAPVVYGEWGCYEPFSDGYRCSNCKLTHRNCTTYCPNCGAKMDEKAVTL